MAFAAALKKDGNGERTVFNRFSYVYTFLKRYGNRNGKPLPCLRLGRYIRFDWTRVVQWLTYEKGDSRRGRRR
jgi:hypothetical protein